VGVQRLGSVNFLESHDRAFGVTRGGMVGTRRGLEVKAEMITRGLGFIGFHNI
jgi:hypothetical protein